MTTTVTARKPPLPKEGSVDAVDTKEPRQFKEQEQYAKKSP